MKTVAFIRLTAAGTFEKITWTKPATGTWAVKKQPIKPTPEQLLKIAQSMHLETFIKK